MMHRIYGPCIYASQGQRLTDWAECAEGFKKNVKLVEGEKKPELVLQLDC